MQKREGEHKEREKINFLSGRVQKAVKDAGRYIGTVFSFALKGKPELHLALHFQVFFIGAEERKSLSNSPPEIHTISGV